MACNGAHTIWFNDRARSSAEQTISTDIQTNSSIKQSNDANVKHCKPNNGHKLTAQATRWNDRKAKLNKPFLSHCWANWSAVIYGYIRLFLNRLYAKSLPNDFPFHRRTCTYGEQRNYGFLCIRMVSLILQMACNGAHTIWFNDRARSSAEQTISTDVQTNSSIKQSNDANVKHCKPNNGHKLTAQATRWNDRKANLNKPFLSHCLANWSAVIYGYIRLFLNRLYAKSLPNDFHFHRRTCTDGEQRNYGFLCIRMVSFILQTACKGAHTIWFNDRVHSSAEQTISTDVQTNSSIKQSNDANVKHCKPNNGHELSAQATWWIDRKAKLNKPFLSDCWAKWSVVIYDYIWLFLDRLMQVHSVTIFCSTGEHAHMVSVGITAS